MVGKYAALMRDQLTVGIVCCDISAIGLIGETSAMPETKGRRLAIAINSIFIVLFSFYCCEHNHPRAQGFAGVIASERKCRVALSADVADGSWNDDFLPLSGLEPPLPECH
jgi:hypothetical protein